MTLFSNPKRPLIMGILNMTPDSFSGDGLMSKADPVSAALALGMRMIEDGADILDIGGESSRPGAKPVPEDEELRRVIPIIEALKKISGSVHIAVDTVKAHVAEAALQVGASIINDISALIDSELAVVAAKYGAYIVLMHNRSQAPAITCDVRLGSEYHPPVYGNIIEDVKNDLLERIHIAKKAHIADDKIIIDPGLGFGKSTEQNMALIHHCDALKSLGYPLLIGPSRKSFIGRALGAEIHDRLEGTAASIAIATLQGADMIRVHDVKFMARVAKMAALIAKN